MFIPVPVVFVTMVTSSFYCSKITQETSWFTFYLESRKVNVRKIKRYYLMFAGRMN